MLDDVGPEVVDSDAEQPAPPPAKPRVWTVFAAVTLATMVNIGLSVIVVVALMVNAVLQGASVQDAGDALLPKLMTPGMFMVLILFGGLAYGLGAIIPAWLSPMPIRERLGLPRTGVPASVYLLAMFGSIAPFAIALGMAQALTLIIPPDESVQMLYDNMTLVMAVPFVLGIAISPGISEELMFRGYIQGRLLQRWSPGWAIGVTSLIFAIVHFQPHTVVFAFPLGLWFGFLSWKCGSIGPSILCHAFVNGSLNAWRLMIKFGEISEGVQIVVQTAIVVVGLVCFVLLLRRFAIKKDPLADLSNDVDSGVDAEVIGGD